VEEWKSGRVLHLFYEGVPREKKKKERGLGGWRIAARAKGSSFYRRAHAKKPLEAVIDD
jgi:hypothetical protein